MSRKPGAGLHVAHLAGVAAAGCVLGACFGAGSSGSSGGATFDSGTPQFDASHPDEGLDVTAEAESGADATADVTVVDSTAPEAAADGPAADGTADASGTDGPAEGAAPCNPLATPNASTGFFVSATAGSDTTGDGSIANPFATIGKGIAKAAASSAPNVYVAPGTYAESLDIPPSAAGIFVQGGWSVAAGNAWSADCAPGASGRTVVQGGATVVSAISIPLASGLSTLTLQTPADVSTSSPGESLIGVLVSGSNVSFSLVDVDVVAGSAGNGAAAVPTAPVSGTVCGACTNTTTNGTTPAPGTTASAPGTFGASGFTPADGKDGQGGDSGSTGSPPPAAETINYTSGCSGGCFVACSNVTSQVTGNPGGCGCGGAGGDAGRAGHGGGASVAVLAYGQGVTVDVTRSALTAGNGGAGTVGGAGGAAAPGTSGYTGKSTCSSNVTCGNPGGGCVGGNFGPCGAVAPITSVCAAGSTGGTGGNGGAGSAGGGGAGGPSYAVVTAAGATASVDGASVLTFGTGGAGGGSAPGGGSGAQSQQ